MQLPLIKTNILDLSLLSTRWKSLLDPVIKNPANNVSILENVSLASGNNQIPHLLDHKQQGWFIVDINGAATIYRYQPLNEKFLYLNSSAAVVVNLGVF